MKSLITVLNACKPIGVGLASMTIIGGSAIAVIHTVNNMSGGPESQSLNHSAIVSVLESSDEAIAEITKEPVATPDPEPEPTPTATATQPKAKVQTQSAATQPKATAQTTPTYRYTDEDDFNAAYKGWCPQDVPPDAYHRPLSWATTLGYSEIDYFSYTSPEEAAIYVWSWWQGSRTNSKNASSVFLTLYYRKMGEPIKGSNGLTYNNFTFTADNYTKTVTWDKRDSYPADVVAQVDAIALRIKNKMIQLDQQYHAKCGY